MFRRQLSADAYTARLAEFDARFPGRGIAEDGSAEPEFPIVENVAADSVLQGVEAHSDIQITSRFATELGLDYVRGTVTDTGEFLPRIPPLRFRAFTSRGVLNTITARLDNATNELYRNHLSLIKELVPEMGRNFKLLYSVKF